MRASVARVSAGADPSIENRKRQQLHLALAESSQSTVSPGWEDVHFVPTAIPEVSPDEVDMSVGFLGQRLATPVIISGMTGGHPDAVGINHRLGELAEELGIAVGVGSQRAALLDESLVETYRAVRIAAPTATVIANIGVAQLVRQGTDAPIGTDGLRRVVEMVEAQVLAIHLNVLEELVQPEGDRNMTGFLAAIGGVVASVGVPVLVKETGAGMDRKTAVRLVDLGVAAIDVGGLGGTSFARIEAERARNAGEVRRAHLGTTFADWGIPTAASILEVRDAGVPVVATGGVRNGLDAAKAIALGATAVGIGRPMLSAAIEGSEPLRNAADRVLDELRTAMVLTGSATVVDLAAAPIVLSGFVRTWADDLTRRDAST